MSQKVVVVDLDGTLLNVNTFHKWLLFLFKKTLITNPIDSIKVLYTILLRLIKFNTHKQMKYKILKISEKEVYVSFVEEFIESLNQYINEEVLLHVDKNSITILATAAPALYTQAIAQKYRFTYSLSTPSTDSKTEWKENIREEKGENLRELLNFLHVEKAEIVLSDHHDDISIMEMAKSVYLVNASKETKDIIKAHSLIYSSISTIAS